MGSNDRTTNYEEAISILLSGEKTDPDFIKQCFWELKAECDSSWKKILRWAIIGLSAICLFELLNRSLVGEFTLSGIKVVHLSFLLYIIPPVVAVSLLNVATFNIEQNIYIRTLREFARQQFPSLHESQLLEFFFAHQGTPGTYFPSTLVESRVEISVAFSQAGQFYLVPIAYVAFELYAYFQLFMHVGRNNLPVIISLCVSAILLALACFLIFSKDQDLEVPTLSRSSDIPSRN